MVLLHSNSFPVISAHINLLGYILVSRRCCLFCLRYLSFQEWKWARGGGGPLDDSIWLFILPPGKMGDREEPSL